MPFELKYDRDNKFLVITLKDNFSTQEFVEVMDAITRSGDFPADVPVLWDSRLIKMPAVDRNIFSGFIEIRKKYPERGNSKLAIVVADDYSFGMSRMYEMLTNDLPQNIMVFRDYQAGMKWLCGR